MERWRCGCWIRQCGGSRDAGGIAAVNRLATGPVFKSLARDLPQFQRMTLHYLGLGTQEQLREDVLDAILDRAFLSDKLLPRDRAAFERCWSAAGPGYRRRGRRLADCSGDSGGLSRGAPDVGQRIIAGLGRGAGDIATSWRT